MKNSRSVAFEAIYNILYNGAYSNLEIDRAISDLSEGKAFASRLAYGVVERQLTLDYLVNLYCTKPKPKVRVILLMGTYQLYFMNKVPAASAIDESVKLAKQVGLSYYSKLINAVLHKIDSNRINIDSLFDLSVKYSVPQNLINMWIKQYGKDVTQNILNSVNGRPPVFAVPNYTLSDAEGLANSLLAEGVNCEIYNDIVKINSAFNINALKSFKDGLFHIQDYSCYNSIKALDIKQGSVVLDICAAPGGKSFTAASICKDNCKIYSYDIHPHRVKLIADGAMRLKLRSINACVNDATKFESEIPKADYIICDVPCSGFGIIRRKPEIRYKELDDIKELPNLQFDILSNSAKYLKQGGRILYSTCTLNKKENEAVVNCFLEKRNNFKLVETKTVFPENDGGDGFYYSVIERL